MATPAFGLYSRRMATEDEGSSPPDITVMLHEQNSACKAARDAIATGNEVVLYDGQPPQWMVVGIAATRLKRSLKIGLTTLGLDETVEILSARHLDEKLRTGNIVAADRSWFFTLYFDSTEQLSIVVDHSTCDVLAGLGDQLPCRGWPGSVPTSEPPRRPQVFRRRSGKSVPGWRLRL